MKQTRMKSFVEQSERHYVSVPRHHLWSRIYIILRVLVFHYMSRVCICMHFHVFARVWLCICVCLRVLRYSLSLFLSFSLLSSLLFSHSHSFTRVLSHFSLSLPSFRASFAAHVLPARLSLPLCLTFGHSACALLSRCNDTQFAYFYGLNSTRRQGNHARSNENHNCFSFDPAFRVGSQ